MMRPRLKFFIQCDEVRNENGKFSAIGIFDTIYSLVFPVSHRRFFLFMGLVGPEGRYELQLLIRGPNDQPIAEVRGELNLSGSDRVGNVVFGLENFPLPAPGRYMVTVFLEGDFLAEFPFFAARPFDATKRTPEDIQSLLQRDDVVKTANCDVVCPKCKATYRFQYNLDPTAPVAPGFLPIPPGDEFVCGTCTTRIPIADLRLNLQHLVGIPREWVERIPPNYRAKSAGPNQSPSPDEGASEQ